MSYGLKSGEPQDPVLETSDDDVSHGGSLPDLSEIEDIEPSTSSHLDGHYFDKVFKDYKGYHGNPLVITFASDGHTMAYMDPDEKVVPTDNWEIIRISIKGAHTHHANGCVFHRGSGTAIRVEPETNKMYSAVDAAVDDTLQRYLGMWFKVKDYKTRHLLPEDHDENGKGWCVAYVIAWIWHFLTDEAEPDWCQYEPDRLAGLLEHVYGEIPEEYTDRELAWNDGDLNVGAILGGLALTGLAAVAISSISPLPGYVYWNGLYYAPGYSPWDYPAGFPFYNFWGNPGYGWYRPGYGPWARPPPYNWRPYPGYNPGFGAGGHPPYGPGPVRPGYSEGGGGYPPRGPGPVQPSRPGGGYPGGVVRPGGPSIQPVAGGNVGYPGGGRPSGQGSTRPPSPNYGSTRPPSPNYGSTRPSNPNFAPSRSSSSGGGNRSGSGR